MIYLDHHATTPLDPEALSVMLPYLKNDFGNASSGHSAGVKAKAAVEWARATIAEQLNCEAEEIFFTSGATEAVHLVFQGFVQRHTAARFWTNELEHACVFDLLRHLQAKTLVQRLLLPMGRDGLIHPSWQTEQLQSGDFFDCLHAHNELGTIHDFAALTALKRSGVDFFWHSDLTQTAGKLQIDLQAWPLDAASASAHKFYGPKGVGFAFVRKSAQAKIAPFLYGGGQERGLRGGTQNVAGIVGMAVALKNCHKLMQADQEHTARLRDRLQAALQELYPDSVVHGPRQARLHCSLNIALPGLRPAQVMAQNPELCFSSGAACSSGSTQGSRVLRSLGLDEEIVLSSFRFGLGRNNTEQEIDKTIALFAKFKNSKCP